MSAQNKSKIERYFVIFMTFFIFAGYSAGLAIILSTGNASLSRFYSVPLRVFQLIIAIVFLIYFIKNLKFKNVDWYLFYFFLFYVIKVIFTESVNVNNSLARFWYEYVIYFILYCYSIYMFFRYLNVKKYLNLIINTLLFSGFLFGIILILFYRDVLFASQVGRFGSSLENSNETIISPLAVAYSGALNLSLLIPYLLLNFKALNIKFKIYYILNVMISMFMFVMGATRGAFVVVLLSLFLILYTVEYHKKIKYIIYFSLLVPLFYFFLDFTGSSLLKRFDSTFEKNDTGGRNKLWSASFDEFIQNPIFGGQIEVSKIYPHNIIIEVLMGMGIIGLLMFSFIIMYTLKGIKLNNNTIYLYVIFINGFFQYMFSGALYVAIILFFSIGLFNGFKFNYNEK